MPALSELQAKWQAAHEKHREFTRQLEFRYGRPWYVYAPGGKREQADRLSKRADAAMEKVFQWLDQHSPRPWRTGVPCFWVCENLTESDALTSGQLSVIPPAPYGYYPSDSIRFAAPVRQELAPSW